MTTDDKTKQIANKRNLEVPGRRKEDQHQCAIHDFIMGRNEDWFNWIKKTIEINDAKISRRFEIMEQSLSKYITKWAVGTLISVSTCLFGAIILLGRWQVEDVHEDVLGVAKSIKEVSSIQKKIVVDQAKFNLIQQNVLIEIEEVKKDQNEIANDVFNIKNDLDYKKNGG